MGVPSLRYRRAMGLVAPPRPKAAPRYGEPCEVYFVQAETLRLIKIGVATSTQDRLGALRVGSPDKLNLLGVLYGKGAKAREAELHGRFNHLHDHGEWFQPGADLLAFIAEECPKTESFWSDEVRAILAR